ncbi:hypothetical protein B879_04187 [Cecembia lonarensis LW9]|uniref:Uncharacterized protein n=1 Tax=Cecembia lonarensis (strain CCUG 58316 / KCTC 22772 / LW9) TaxID=1225176 RepID=K1LSY7_CECL9|nr:hypothetical protein B879_04187 [Cecembia lonarensis LW9]
MVEGEVAGQAQGAGELEVAGDDFGDGAAHQVPGFLDQKVRGPALGAVVQHVRQPGVHQRHHDGQGWARFGEVGHVEDRQALAELDLGGGFSVDEPGKVIADQPFEFEGDFQAPTAQLGARDLHLGCVPFVRVQQCVHDVADGCHISLLGGGVQRPAVGGAQRLALQGGQGPAEGLFGDGPQQHGLTGR